MTQINDFTPQQISEFLDFIKFENQKREEIKEEISVELNELVENKFDNNELYNGQDVLLFKNELTNTINKTLDIELERQRDIIVLLYKHLFLQAQDLGIILNLSIPELNNEENTNNMSNFCEEILTYNNNNNKNINQNEIIDNFEEIKLENIYLKEEIKKNKREWKEFILAQNKLKLLNSQIHELKENKN